MNTLLDENCDIDRLSPLALAFIGDTVYDILVREMLVSQANRPVKKLHECAVRSVCACAQSEAYIKILPLLSHEEETILKRGRNAHVNHIPKNGNPRDYHYATALECLFGYLYLAGKTERMKEIFKEIMKAEGN